MSKPQALVILSTHHADACCYDGRTLRSWQRFDWTASAHISASANAATSHISNQAQAQNLTQAPNQTQAMQALTAWLAQHQAFDLTVVCDLPETRFQLTTLPTLRRKDRQMLLQRQCRLWLSEGWLSSAQAVMQPPVTAVTSERQAAKQHMYVWSLLAEQCLSELQASVLPSPDLSSSNLPSSNLSCLVIRQLTLLPLLTPQWVAHYLPLASHALCLLCYDEQLTLTYVFEGQLLVAYPAQPWPSRLGGDTHAAKLQTLLSQFRQAIVNQLSNTSTDQNGLATTEWTLPPTLPVLCLYDEATPLIAAMPPATLCVPLYPSAHNAKQTMQTNQPSGLAVDLKPDLDTDAFLDAPETLATNPPPMLYAVFKQRTALADLPNLASVAMQHAYLQQRQQQVCQHLVSAALVISLAVAGALAWLQLHLTAYQQQMSQRVQLNQQRLQRLMAQAPEAKQQAMVAVYNVLRQQFSSPQQVLQALRQVPLADYGWQLSRIDWQIQNQPVQNQQSMSPQSTAATTLSEPLSKPSSKPWSQQIAPPLVTVTLQLQPIVAERSAITLSQANLAPTGWPKLLARLRALPNVADLQVQPLLAANGQPLHGDTRLSAPASPMQVTLFLRPVASSALTNQPLDTQPLHAQQLSLAERDSDVAKAAP